MMKLGLVLLGHQYLQQLPPQLRAAILGNVASGPRTRHRALKRLVAPFRKGT
jgi:hypothetical protein